MGISLFIKLKHLPKKVMLSIFAQILMSVSALVQLKILTSNFPPKMMGSLNTLITFTSLFQMVAFGPVCNSLVRFNAQESDSSSFHRFIGSLNCFCLLLTALFSLPYLFYLMMKKEIDLSPVSTFIIIMSVSVSLLISSIGTSYLISSEQQKLFFKVTLADFVIRPLLLALMIKLTAEFSSQAEVVFTVLPVITLLPFAYSIYIKKIPIQLFIETPYKWMQKIKAGVFHSPFKYAAGFIPVSILGFTCSYSDRLMAIRYLEPSDLAMIAVVQQTVCSPLQIVIGVVFASILPGIFNLIPEANAANMHLANLMALRKIRGIALTISLLAIPFLSILYIAGPYYIGKITSPNYIPEKSVLMLYATSGILIAVAQILGSEMLILKKPHLNSLPRIFQLIIITPCILLFTGKIDLLWISIVFFIISSAQVAGFLLLNYFSWKVAARVAHNVPHN